VQLNSKSSTGHSRTLLNQWLAVWDCNEAIWNGIFFLYYVNTIAFVGLNFVLHVLLISTISVNSTSIGLVLSLVSIALVLSIDSP
jgi:hypothetical protein